MKSSALALAAAFVLAGLTTPMRAKEYFFPKDFGMQENGAGIKYTNAIMGGYTDGQYLMLRFEVAGEGGGWSGRFTNAFGNPVYFLLPRLNPDDIVNWCDDNSVFLLAGDWPFGRVRAPFTDRRTLDTPSRAEIALPVGSWDWVPVAAIEIASSGPVTPSGEGVDHNAPKNGLLFSVGSNGGSGPRPPQQRRITILAGSGGVMLLAGFRDSPTEEEFQLAADYLLRQNISQIYAPLLQSLGMNPADVTTLKNLLARRQAVREGAWAAVWEKSKILLEIPFPKTNPLAKSTRRLTWYSDADRAAWAQLVAGPTAPIDVRIRALLDEDKFKAWQSFEKTIPVRQSFAAEFSDWKERAVTPLTEAETEKVIAAVCAANPGYGTAYDVAVEPVLQDAKKYLSAAQGVLLMEILNAKRDFFRSVGTAMANRKP